MTLTKDNNINVTNTLSNYSMTAIFASEGNLQVHYRGIDPGITISGMIYVYNSMNFRRLLGTYSYPTDQIYIVNGNSSYVTLFYVGDSKNSIQLVSRIREYHAANCYTENNLIFLNNLYVYKEISALSSGNCELTTILPLSQANEYAYYFVPQNLIYDKDEKVSVFSGTNRNDALFGFNMNNLDLFDYIWLNGIMISFVIPPNSSLSGFYETFLFNVNNNQRYSAGDIFDVIMSPSYPFLVPASYNFTRRGYYSVDHARITLTITASIPDQCYFIIHDGNKTHYELSNNRVQNHSISFNGTLFQIDFTTYNASVEWTGFLVRVEGFRLNSTEAINVVHEKKSALKEGLIIGFSTLASITGLIIIGLFTWYQLKKRFQKFDQLCNVLKEMKLSPEAIAEMKEKSDELLITPSKLHINFDHIFGQGSSSTVYKAYLMGPAPLHLIQRSIVTQRFVDCDVAVKVATRFGSEEVDQLFKGTCSQGMVGKC